MRRTPSLATVQRNLSRAIKRIEGDTARGIERAANWVGDKAQAQAPKDTGELRESKIVTMDDSASPVATIAFTAPHAARIHEAVEVKFQNGRSKFLQRTIDEGRKTILAIIREDAKVK